MIKFLKERRERRERVRKAFVLMAASGVIRSADTGIRRVMSDKELQKFLTEKDEQA
jgi:hypothetical protein